MSEPRRDAWRLPHDGVGWLAARGFRAVCVVEDISVSGARVHISSVRLAGPRPLPDRLTLTVVVGGEQVTIPGGVTRINRGPGGIRLALHFVDGDAVNLGWLINQAQRADIRAARAAAYAGGSTDGAPAATSASGTVIEPSSC